MAASAFILVFVLGRMGSVLLYQACWKNGQARRFHAWGAFATFLARPLPWLWHLPILAWGAGMDWQGMPALRLFVFAAGGVFALGAAGRWGAADLGRFFLSDRILIGALWLGTWASPLCLYPLLLAGCCLQYTVSGWPLQPGYSNLLGFEFMRRSLCHALAGMLAAAGLRRLGWDAAGAEGLALALVLCGQAAGYVPQALAKCALGRHWYSWILENRLQCLAVNAWLRGWGARRIAKASVLRLARGIARIRVPLCAAAWLIEIAWFAILADVRFACALLAATAAFHLAVWLATGLAGYPFLASHALMIVFIASPSAPRLFASGPAWAAAGCIAAAALWTLLLRRRLYLSYVRTGSPGAAGRFLDPADHLMAWWDGPYMRMYAYSVETESGRRCHFPVTQFSPYDTFLTDIHTHLMILGRDWELDPRLPADRAFLRTGVWGLTVSLADRDRAYRLMDDPAADPVFTSPGSEGGGEGAAGIGADEGAAADPARRRAAAPLLAFFRGLNRARMRKGFRLILRRPHFPGEDLVPDWSPLAERLPAYDGSEAIVAVACHRIRTLQRGGDIRVLEDRVFARLRIAAAPAPAEGARAGRMAVPGDRIAAAPAEDR
jgi:hypothetical protein